MRIWCLPEASGAVRRTFLPAIALAATHWRFVLGVGAGGAVGGAIGTIGPLPLPGPFRPHNWPLPLPLPLFFLPFHWPLLPQRPHTTP